MKPSRRRAAIQRNLWTLEGFIGLEVQGLGFGACAFLLKVLGIAIRKQGPTCTTSFTYVDCLFRTHMKSHQQLCHKPNLVRCLMASVVDVIQKKQGEFERYTYAGITWGVL